MLEIILVIHVGAAFLGFTLSGILSVLVLRQREYTNLSLRFWRIERLTQWVTVVLGAAGVSLYLLGKRPPDPLHLLYGALAILSVIVLGAFGPDKDPKEVLQGWQVSPRWLLFGVNAFLWAMYVRGLTTGLFGF